MKIRTLFLSMFLLLNVNNPAWADNHSGVTLISTELMSGLLEKREGMIEGIYPDFFAQAASKAGVTIDYRIVPWSRAVLETEKSKKYLLFPFTRTSEREERFSWLAKLWEVPICFISSTRPMNSFEEAKLAEGIMVWRGSSHQQKLVELGFANLIPFDDPRLVKRVLSRRDNVAWYTPCNEGLSLLGMFNAEQPIIIGKVVDHEEVWLAGGKHYLSTDERQRFLDAVGELAPEGTLRRRILIEGR
ncbi:hypothetical protein ACMXYO_13740 [Neptuniibacter sp. QD37_6]|uniref:hypothetical protein n=1 Tax=Neptuniibacter sp. QD37_6 TaxID=3398210 RepID=UPI0039F58253